MLSDKDIEYGKANASLSLEGHHDHNDCIRIAYAWLDSQKKTKSYSKKQYALKHMIESWAGRYVSQTDVEVAAWLHPDIRGSYPYYNISSRLTLPAESRLLNIREANKHTSYKDGLDLKMYSIIEQ